jgi:transcriptional regulator with XRE-family HTH domain
MESQKIGNKHLGRQVKRFRESIGMKQEILAKELNTTQQSISYYEKQEDLDEILFEQLAQGMGVSPDILRNFNMESQIFSIQEMRDSSQAIYNYNFSPIEKIVEQAAKIEKLYEDILKVEREKIELLANTNKVLHSLIEKAKE